MKLIVGLGNPGRIYTESRHNVGYSVVKSLGRIYKASFKKDNNTFSLSGKGRISGENVMMALPLTFMNLSGVAVSALMKKYKIGLEGLLVVYDDLDLPLGAIRIRRGGSSAGHKGLESIIASVESREFGRLRIGISRPASGNTKIADFVLSPFKQNEKKEIKETIESACDAIRVWATEGITKSMSIFNRNNKYAHMKGIKV